MIDIRFSDAPTFLHQLNYVVLLELNNSHRKAQEAIAQTEGRRAAEALEREAAMERRLASAELQLRAERASNINNSAHLLEADEGLREREAAWDAQRKILVDDAERLRERLYEVTRERDEASMKLSALMGDDTADSAGHYHPFSTTSESTLEKKAYEAEVSELTLTVQSLREEIRSKDETMSELKRYTNCESCSAFFVI